MLKLHDFCNRAPATALINAAEAKAKGFEAELTVRPVEGLMLNATWGYIDGKITKTTPVAQAQGLLVGNRLTKTPKNKISLAAQYDWEIFGSDAFARIDYSWQSSRSEEHTSELQSLMRISYAVFCLKTKNTTHFIILLTQTLNNVYNHTRSSRT